MQQLWDFVIILLKYVAVSSHCSKSSFFWVKNSWKCCGLGLFSCWQLISRGKLSKKNFGWKTREIEFLDKKFDFSNSVILWKLRHRKKKNFGITLFFRTIGEILRKITSTVTITGSLLFSTVTDPNTRNQWKENFCRKLKLMYRIQITTKTIGNQVSTEQMYLGYVWFKRWWPYCIIMMYSDVFLHYIDDRNYNWHQCIMDWVMRNILGVFFYKIQ